MERSPDNLPAQQDQYYICVDEKADHGPIILQKAVEVKNGDTPEILQRRVMEQAEWNILPEAIDLIGAGKVSVQNGIAVVSR